MYASPESKLDFWVEGTRLILLEIGDNDFLKDNSTVELKITFLKSDLIVI